MDRCDRYSNESSGVAISAQIAMLSAPNTTIPSLTVRNRSRRPERNNKATQLDIVKLAKRAIQSTCVRALCRSDKSSDRIIYGPAR